MFCRVLTLIHICIQGVPKQDQKSIDAIESNLISEPSLIIDDNIIEELPDGCSGPVV